MRNMSMLDNLSPKNAAPRGEETFKGCGSAEAVSLHGQMMFALITDACDFQRKLLDSNIDAVILGRTGAWTVQW